MPEAYYQLQCEQETLIAQKESKRHSRPALRQLNHRINQIEFSLQSMAARAVIVDDALVA